MNYLFGSSLIKKYFSDFRAPNDIDWVTNDLSYWKESKPGEEYYYIPFSPNREMTPDEIYTLKVSHSIYDIHWKKTMSDIRFLQIKNCKIVPSFLNDLREYWNEVHFEQKRTNFDVKSGGEFFNDKIKRKMNHDALHKLINPSPTYFKVIIGEVEPSIEKYSLLSSEDKKELLFEEAFVIAVERFSKEYDNNAYFKAQQNLVTRLHPVWLSDEIILNWNNYYWTPRNSKFFNNYKNIKSNF